MKFDCRVPACVLMTHLVHLLVTPGRAGMLARMMPTVARTIGCARTGTLWEGRYELARQDPQRASIPLGPMRIGLLCWRSSATYGSSLVFPGGRTYFNSSRSGSLSHFLIVLRDRLVRLAISLIGVFSRKCIRRTLAYMLMVITSSSCWSNTQQVRLSTLVNSERENPRLPGQF